MRKDRGGVEVQPPEEQASSTTVYWVKGWSPVTTACVDKPEK